ncbi:MAG: hypothetical protein ACMUHU_05670 [Thermoplasmatota archaeon]
MVKKGSKKKDVEFDDDIEVEEDTEKKKKAEEDEEEDTEDVDGDEGEEEDEEDPGAEDEEDEDDEDEEDEDDEEEMEEEDEEEKPKKKSKKEASSEKGKEKQAATLAKIGLFCGIFAVAGLLLSIIIDVLEWRISGVWCFTCFFWPVIGLGSIAAVAAIGLGIAKIAMDTKGDKKLAIISIALGAVYIVSSVAWQIVFFIIRRFL